MFRKACGKSGALPSRGPRHGPCQNEGKPHPAANHSPPERRHIMGKYVLGWLLGVPVTVLVILYLIFH
ncbi:MAG: hypothetical protein ACTHL8_18970 [Burkholderiaceae bacterium]